MTRILRHPAVNAACLGLFSGFYGLLFFLTDGTFAQGLGTQGTVPFWQGWEAFLAAGNQRYAAGALLVLTALVAALLLTRRRPYDEYHTALLMQCLAVAVVLTLIAIALFYLIVLRDPSGVVGKLTLFIIIHWAAVVLSDLAYVLLCRWR